MAHSAAAAHFAPFQPPPDAGRAPQSSSSSSAAPRSAAAGLYRDEDPQGAGSYYEDDDPRYATESYQSGTLASHKQQQQQSHEPPSYSQSSGAQAIGGFQGWSVEGGSHAGGAGARSFAGPNAGAATQPDHASFVTSQGMGVSNLCFAAWALPPFSGVFVLIFETTNDLARFHAYQSALCGVAGIVLLYILRSWFGWYTLSVIAGMGALGAAWVAGSNAHRAAPTLAKVPYLSYIGPLADEWVGTE